MPANFGTTARYALRKLLGSSLISDIDAGFAALADDVDAKMMGWTSGLIADLPGATVSGRHYYATDTGQLLVDTGSAWIEPGATVGDVKIAARATPLFGWVAFNGQQLSRSTFARLWAHAQAEISAGNTLFNNGDGSSTFGLADLRGRALVMAGQGTGLTSRTLGALFGAETVQLTAAESGMPAHGHGDTFAVDGATIGTNPGTHVVPIAGGVTPFNAEVWGGGGSSARAPFSSGADWSGISSNHVHGLSGAVSPAAAANASQAHNNVQPSAGVNVFVKT